MIIPYLKLVVKESRIMNTEFKKNRHSIYNLTYHLVVITKYRRKCINEEVLEDLKEISKRLLGVKGGSVLEVNGGEDHLHILFECPPQVELAKLVNTFKTVCPRLFGNPTRAILIIDVTPPESQLIELIIKRCVSHVRKFEGCRKLICEKHIILALLAWLTVTTGSWMPVGVESSK